MLSVFCPVWKAENAAVGFDVLTTCQPSTDLCSRERLPEAAAQPAKVRQSCGATDLFFSVKQHPSSEPVRIDVFWMYGFLYVPHCIQRLCPSTALSS
jgi:hypothetical protein